MENSKSISSGTNQIAKNKEEIMIMGSVNDMIKYFIKENAIIWHDPNIHTPENTAYINELKSICDIQVFVDWKDASEYLTKETQLSYCQVITSGTNGELFVKEISGLHLVSRIYVFCDSIDYDKTWVSQYPKVVYAGNNFEGLIEKIRQSMITWQRKSSSLRVNLPSFAPIFDDIDLSEMNHIQLYLQGLINFTNRPQAKNDFLNLARALYGKNSYIEKFEKDYNHYDMKAILNWYTQECFLYRLTNNCLRIAKPDSIQYCRLLLKDLETAIKDKYQQHSHKFTGLLYRGAYLSDDEWARLQQNLNRDIEMHGFLSTTKQKEIAIGFCQEDMDKKAMVSIIVPNFPDKGDQGFAEMGEYTDFPEEDEVLFNVRSRFTVLEATLEEIDGMKIRHLVLLYGAQAMRRYATLHNPIIEVQIDCSSENAECKVCQKKIGINKESVRAVNICNSREYFCHDCTKQPYITNKLVLLYVSPSAHNLLSLSSENIKSLNIKIEGTVIQNQDNLNIPFYGERCAICRGTKLSSCFKCSDCQDTKINYCTNCFYDQNMTDCLRKGHVIIGQDSPFSFWSQKMSKIEENHLNYRKEQLEKTNHLFQQGKIFYETHNYEKAIEYFQNYLEKVGNLKNEQVATSYNNLGEAYRSLGEYQRAIEYHFKALEIDKTVFGDYHLRTATSYGNIGNAYNSLGEYQKAVEYYSKALDIKKAVFGDNNPSTATSYGNLGSAYYSLGEYQKAIEYLSNSLEVEKVVYGDNHPSTAISYSNLGAAYQSLGKYQKAIEYHSKSMDVRKTVFGENHPSTAASYNNLALVYENLGEYQKAKEYYFKTLSIRKVVFGENHPYTATSYGSLGAIYDGLGEYEKAMEYHFKSLEIYKAVLGDNNPSTALSYGNLGATYDNLGEYQKALEYHFKALDIRKAVFGDNHPTTALSFNNLGSSYDNLGEYQKAIEYYFKALDIFKAVFVTNHPRIATAYNNIGLVYHHLGDCQKALEYHFKALDIRKSVLGDNNSTTATSYNNIAIAYDDLGEDKKAIEYYSKSLGIYKVALGDKHPNTVSCSNNLQSLNSRLK